MIGQKNKKNNWRKNKKEDKKNTLCVKIIKPKNQKKEKEKKT